MAILKNDWAPLLEGEFAKPYYQRLRTILREEYQTQVIYPDQYDIYNALHFTSFEDTKVVIIGQDPYHGPGQAHGLSFSVKPGVKIPPSLQNIYKELQSDVGCYIPNHGYLVDWTKQGVLLLNAVLTVRAGIPNSHKALGWEMFTDKVIETLNQRGKPVVFILWGAYAQQKQQLITSSRHFIIKSPHPSPFSANRGFFGSRPFSRANAFLREIGSGEIDWQIRNLS
ncbi:uracil-DNA glycosylase [Schinkia azotoformans]|uniref:Uracil-DNA glycosylase n=1 Tax=Schinkia azotoformans LMG 9581 TaxID=1131731 RepID=K6DJX2_SCHAZ|nr:uracil-DNA glycosylase [Schinkia azotoformans]EKN68604.1 uracil-DNA glycosylase [Schinkia azotoformans LMG 9581]MEC1637629.1 uracil-DNA glycosylase [Schinkia azotoformans]MEC1718795.1 uracil-DNA glycosylase [Schinkia azotoformans]MEC1944034.1 uracil-DNA glycosylase [Schinkia azotoformans]MED4351032.1 uracil-DNA glycosylase [Schinkia azotoformans]